MMLAKYTPTYAISDTSHTKNNCIGKAITKNLEEAYQNGLMKTISREHGDLKRPLWNESSTRSDNGTNGTPTGGRSRMKPC